MKRLLVILAIVACSTVGWLGYKSFFQGDMQAAFITKPLERGDIVKTVAATGTIEPLIKVIVGSQVSGRIKKWYADFNAEVTENFVLAEIDPDRFQTAYDRTNADLALAKAKENESMVRFKDAERECNRVAALREKNTASENEFLVALATKEAAKAVLEGASAGILSAEAALREAKVDLERTIIRSPIKGIVISRNIEDGQTVAASLQAPELFVIANDLRKMRVNANVSEADIGLIQHGAEARFRVDAYPSRMFTGIISQVRYNPTIVDGVVTYVTLIEVSNDDLVLRPGMTANVTFIVAKVEKTVRIPNAALRFDPNPPESSSSGIPQRRAMSKKPTVYVLTNGRPEKREIEIGLSDGVWTELKGGDIKENDTVIVERSWQAGNSAGQKPSSDPSRSFRRF